LAGGIACAGAMLAIDLLSGVVAIVVLFAIYQYLENREIPARWVDGRRSHHLYEARRHLLAAAAETEHPRNWRPQLLVLSSAAARRERLLRFTSWVEGNSGLVTLVHMIEGQGEKMVERREQMLKELGAEIKAGEFTVFPLVVAAADLDQLLASLVQTVGIGPLRVNTLVSNWATGESSIIRSFSTRRAGRNLRTAFRLGCNILILDADAREWETLEQVPSEQRVIDVWVPGILGHLWTGLRK
jgi:hypothetical protein